MSARRRHPRDPGRDGRRHHATGDHGLHPVEGGQDVGLGGRGRGDRHDRRRAAGRAWPVIRAIQSLKPMTMAGSVRSNASGSAQGAGRTALGEVERAGRQLLVVPADPVEVLADLVTSPPAW